MTKTKTGTESQTEMRILYAPLSEEDIPVDKPIDVRVIDEDGTLLLDRGAVLPTLEERASLFHFFRPHCEEVELAAVDDGESTEDAPVQNDKVPKARPLRLRDMALSIDTRLGIRLPLGAGKRTYASRLIGLAPHDALFTTPPSLGQERLLVTVGEQVEVLAVSAKAIYLFSSTVEAVCNAPFPYLVLSTPGLIRRVRERRAVRVRSRLAVFYTAQVGDVHGLGVVRDISRLDLSLLAAPGLGDIGASVRLVFYIEMNGLALRIDVASLLRSITPGKTADAPTQYGLEFSDLKPDEHTALRNFVIAQRQRELGHHDE